MEEQWKQIDGTHYEVSNTGKVRHIVNQHELKGDTVQIEHEPRRRETVARLVYMAFIGEIPENKVVFRKDSSCPPSVWNIYIPEKATVRPTHTQEIINLKSQGMINSEIAKTLGITPGAVTKCLKRHREKAPD